MRKLRALWIRFAGLLLLRRADHDFSDELESHIAMHVEDGDSFRTEPRGSAPSRAHPAGWRGTSPPGAARTAHGLPWLESSIRDVRYAIRTLAKHPAVTAIAVLSIGLGIGANATIFSMVSRFVLRPAPVGDPSTLLALHIAERGEQCCNSFPLPIYHDLQRPGEIVLRCCRIL